MAATMWGSLDTLVRALGGSGPKSVMLEMDERLIFALHVPPSMTLLLVAPRSTGKRRLRQEGQRLVSRLKGLRRVPATSAAQAEVVD